MKFLTNPRQLTLVIRSLQASMDKAGSAIERTEYKSLIDYFDYLQQAALISSVLESGQDPARHLRRLVPAFIKQKGMFYTANELFTVIQHYFSTNKIHFKTVQNILTLCTSEGLLVKIKLVRGGLCYWGFQEWLDPSQKPLPVYLDSAY
jgi:hypothetical protein